MADFAKTRQELEAAHAAAAEQQRALHEARLALARLETQRRAAERNGGNAVAGVDERIAEQKNTIGALGNALGQAKEGLSAGLDSFAVFTDPRQRIGELDDAVPILLLPLRIETRFKPKPGPAGNGGQLWVRAYPDDIAVDSFETVLSESEIARAEAYWVNIWRSGGNEAEDRGAWAVLAGAQGSGRSWWVVQNYRPLNEADKPIKNPVLSSVTLVVPAHAPLVDPELAAARTFWEAYWRAGTDAVKQQDAIAALTGAVGADRAAAIQKDYAPSNFADSSPAETERETVPVTVVQIVFPADGAVPVREGGWSQAPHVDVMPDRLVLIGYDGDDVAVEALGAPIPPTLQVGPDPSAPEDEHLRREGEEIDWSGELAWIADFDKAVEVGMGFRLDLDEPQFRRGFDKLLVLGVRLAADREIGQKAVETLFDHHQHGRAGLSIVPQGQPTNNVEDGSAAYSWREDPNVSFDHYFGAVPAPADPIAWDERSDGRWLATALGLKPETLRAVPFYRHGDMGDRIAINTALWPATIGYFMDSLLDTVFDTPTIELTRDFFNRHVTGRGTVPAIRVGKQPYGILPATLRSRMTWLLADKDDDQNPLGIPVAGPEAEFLRRLYALLKKVEGDWEGLLGSVAFIGKKGDQHQHLLDVVGLHSGSVEFYQRWAESAYHLYNQSKLNLFGAEAWKALTEFLYVGQGLGLLADLGWERRRADIPDLLEKLFLDAPNLLQGDLIDDRPLSESERIRAYAAVDRNYLTWLADAAGTSHDALRLQQGFTDGAPTALLYLMMRHALDLSFVEASRQLFVDAGLLAAADVTAMRRDPKFLQVSAPDNQQERIGSRWDLLYRSEAAITGNAAMRVADWIPTVIESHVATAYLGAQIAALRRLEKLPTAALERLFVEHIDLASYRLDGWWTGLMSHQLDMMRGGTSEQDPPRQGLYLGAFGWIENLRPENKQMSPVTLEGELGAIFNKPAEPPLTSDSTNAGFIHTPSLNHAVTAAILRNGYLSNADPANPGSLAVNLSSERVRLALGIVEGMRGEQSLAALLGYQFERGLHDRHDVEIDSFIYDLRKAFPLSGDRFSATKTGDTDELGRKLSAQDIEARNVIDGLALVEHVRETGNGTYPFSKAGLPAADPLQGAAISAEAKRIANIADAVADLAMAESIHQVAQGNYDSAGATLDTYSKGKFPAIPDVVTTPRSGTTLTHRVALHLETGIAAADPGNITPRAQAEPALNRWLAGILPDPAALVCRVTVTDEAAGTVAEHEVSQADLGLAPIDLLYELDPDNQHGMRALDDRVAIEARSRAAIRPDAPISIDYRSRIVGMAGHVPFFETAALMRSCRSLLLRSRPLRATDMNLANDAAQSDDAQATLEAARVTEPRAALAAHRAALDGLRAALEPLVEAANADTTLPIDPALLLPIATRIDGDVDTFADAVLGVSVFAHPDLGPGSAMEERGRIYGLLHDALSERIALWEIKSDAFAAAVTAYDPADHVDDDARFIALHRAETHILAAPSVRPAGFTPDDFLNQLNAVTGPQFEAQLAVLKTLHDNEKTLGGLYAGVDAARAAIAPHDVEQLDLASAEAALRNLANDLHARAVTIVAAVDAQLLTVDARLAEHAAAVEPKERLKAAVAAISALLGERFLAIPEFTLGGTQSAEWAKAWGAGAEANTAILDHLRNSLGRPLPVDDWVAGVARVREKVRHLERADALSEVLRGGSIPLQPLQLPHRDEDYWLALDYPPVKTDGKTPVLDEDKLLYTASYAVPFAAGGAHAGLLVDEWTEIIPARTEDTGLAFHYDRPNSEPPQTLLLAMPSDFTGAWTWQDLVDTVHETMDLARRRAIEPTQIDGTAYARLLPAIVSSVTVHPITASLNFAFNNNVAAAMAVAAGDE